MSGIPLLARRWIMERWLHSVSSRRVSAFSTNFWPIIFEKKFQWISALSKVWRVQRASKWYISPEWRNSLRNVYSSEFWCKFWLRANFCHGVIAEICLKLGSLEICRLPKTFYPVAQTIKRNWASWCPLDCLEWQTGAIQGTVVRR